MSDNFTLVQSPGPLEIPPGRRFFLRLLAFFPSDFGPAGYFFPGLSQVPPGWSVEFPDNKGIVTAVRNDRSWWYESYKGGDAGMPPPNPLILPAVGAPDLNLLVLPVLIWVYQRTGDSGYLALADDAFVQGVRTAWLGTGKHWAQNYRWSIDYIKFRDRYS